MNEELEQLKSNRGVQMIAVVTDAPDGRLTGNGEEMKTLSRNIQNIKNTMEGHAHAHAGIKGSIKEHIEVSYLRINANIHTVCT